MDFPVRGKRWYCSILQSTEIPMEYDQSTDTAPALYHSVIIQLKRVLAFGVVLILIIIHIHR